MQCQITLTWRYHWRLRSLLASIVIQYWMWCAWKSDVLFKLLGWQKQHVRCVTLARSCGPISCVMSIDCLSIICERHVLDVCNHGLKARTFSLTSCMLCVINAYEKTRQWAHFSWQMKILRPTMFEKQTWAGRFRSRILSSCGIKSHDYIHSISKHKTPSMHGQLLIMMLFRNRFCSDERKTKRKWWTCRHNCRMKYNIWLE